ncbi:MAG: DUF1272 domain-containing protein [Kordiimonadaceae bacterium]|nr:DUF1272 domain-containing protein [Kordiimonadaceae bacterium]
MLELRPNCEFCDKDLPPDAEDACICTYECTFCRDCVEKTLENVCPNCGGGFEKRPIRPKMARRPNVSLAHDPASTIRKNTKYSIFEIKEFSGKAKDIPPSKR